MKTKFALTFTLLALILAACSSGVHPAPSLDGTSWMLTTINGQPVVDGSQASLGFSEGQVSGSGSCNGFGGEYTQQGDRLTFGPIVSTLMACLEPGLMDQESAYFTALAAVVSFRMDGGTLSLLDVDGNELLRFSAQDTALEGRTWQLISYSDGSNAIVSVLEGSRITAQFSAGSMSGSAGCNQYNAAYTQDGPALTISDPVSTKMYCEDLMDQETRYLLNLSSVASYRVDGGTLFLLDVNRNLLAEFMVTAP